MLQIKRLEKTFNRGTVNEVRALCDVSLELRQGSFLIIIGTNGSGKSTLLNAVAGSFLPDRGAITLAGQTITNWPEHRRAKYIGRVFQNPFSGTAPTMSIAENLALASRRGTTKRKRATSPLAANPCADAIAYGRGRFPQHRMGAAGEELQLAARQDAGDPFRFAA